MSKINSKTVKALAKASAKHVAAKAAKAVKTVKTAAKAVVSSALKALKAGSDYIALLESDGETAFRRVRYLGEGKFQLRQNNYGLQYDGAQFTVTAENKLEADFVGRLEAGNYICSKGKRASVRILTEEQARKLCNLRVHGELRGVKTTVLCYGNEAAHYLACLDTTGRKAGSLAHAFQIETARLKSNAIHFIAVSRFEKLKGK